MWYAACPLGLFKFMLIFFITIHLLTNKSFPFFSLHVEYSRRELNFSDFKKSTFEIGLGLGINNRFLSNLVR